MATYSLERCSSIEFVEHCPHGSASLFALRDVFPCSSATPPFTNPTLFDPTNLVVFDNISQSITNCMCYLIYIYHSMHSAFPTPTYTLTLFILPSTAQVTTSNPAKTKSTGSNVGWMSASHRRPTHANSTLPTASTMNGRSVTVSRNGGDPTSRLLWYADVPVKGFWYS